MARILIIDDDEDFGDLMQRRLTKARHEVIFRDTPFGTLSEIKKGGYDLVILDMKMPGLDGEGLVGLIRRSSGIQRTKILLLSSMPPDDLYDVARRLMVHGCISKSADTNEVISKVEAVLAASDRCRP